MPPLPTATMTVGGNAALNLGASAGNKHAKPFPSPMQQGDVITGLHLYFVTLADAASVDDLFNFGLYAHSHLPVDSGDVAGGTAIEVENGQLLLWLQELPLVPHLTNGTGGVCVGVCHIHVPVYIPITADMLNMAALVYAGAVAISGNIFLEIDRRTKQPRGSAPDLVFPGY